MITFYTTVGTLENLDKMIENLTETARSYKEGVNEENEFIAHFKKYGT